MRDIPEESTVAGVAVKEITEVTWQDGFTFETAPAFEVSTQYSSRRVERDKLTNAEVETLRELANAS
jgi:hypothetical protein